MMRTLFAVIAGIGLGAVGMAAVEHWGHGNVRTIAERDIVEKLDGKDAKVAFVEVSLGAHRPATTEVEIQRPDGTRLRITYRDTAPGLASLVQTFLGPR